MKKKDSLVAEIETSLRKPFRILLLRARHQCQSIAAKLEKLGGEVIIRPLIEIIPQKEIAKKITQSFLNEFNKIIFTSSNAIPIFIEALKEKGLNKDALSRLQIIAIGSKTEEVLKSYGLRIDNIPSKFCSEGILELFGEDLSNSRILIPCAEAPRELLFNELTQKGAYVELLKIYRSVKPKTEKISIKDGDLVVFTSPSTAHHFFNDESYHQERIIAFCIGNLTASKVQEYLKENIFVSLEATEAALIHCIENYLIKKTLNETIL